MSITIDGTAGITFPNTTNQVTAALANYQEFTASGTWTKPSGATFVMVECWGAGGGGGSGRRGAVNTNRGAGGGGGGGAYVYRLFNVSDLTATVTTTIGAGGTAGAAQTTNDLNGNAGVAGGNTTFGAYLTAYAGGAGDFGAGGSSTTGGGGGGGALAAGNINTGGFPRTSGSVYGQFGGGAQLSSSNNGSSGFGGGAGDGGGAVRRLCHAPLPQRFCHQRPLDMDSICPLPLPALGATSSPQSPRSSAKTSRSTSKPRSAISKCC